MRSAARLLAICSLLVCVKSAHALPFNDDMVLNPMKTGRVMRPSPPGSIAVGMLDVKIESREEALKLTNPYKGDKDSIVAGKRLFEVNCTPCHGNIDSNPYQKGKVGELVPIIPNLSMDFYREKPKNPASGEGRSDGSIYGTIHFGSLSTLMPALGYKLAPKEHWDIINYIRDVQSRSTN